MKSEREAAVGDAAVVLLARAGLRGLTHRAVDAEAGLPEGATSNVARTREALLTLTLRRLTERGAALLDVSPGASADAVALVADTLYRQLTEFRETTAARYELAMEATRRPALRREYDAAGVAFRATAAGLLAALGSAEPARHGRLLVAVAEGVLFDALVGAGAEPTRDELRRGVADVLAGCLRGGQEPGLRGTSSGDATSSSTGSPNPSSGSTW